MSAKLRDFEAAVGVGSIVEACRQAEDILRNDFDTETGEARSHQDKDVVARLVVALSSSPGGSSCVEGMISRFDQGVEQGDYAHVGVLTDLLFALGRDSEVVDLYELLLESGAAGRQVEYLSVALGTRLLAAGRYATFLKNEQTRQNAVAERELFIRGLQQAVVRERLNLAEAYAATGADDLALEEISKVICAVPGARKRIDERLERAGRKLRYNTSCDDRVNPAPPMTSSAAGEGNDDGKNDDGKKNDDGESDVDKEE